MKQDYIIVGATGLVGSEVVRQLGESNSHSIYCLGRRAPEVGGQNIHFVPWDFSSAVEWSDGKPQAPIAICALGTTIKVAGSQAAFRKVDFEFVAGFAELALALGARSLHVVTAHGASVNSGIFYNRVKGEVEAKLMQLGLPIVHIYRPSLLLGDRKEHRTGEKIASVAAKVLSPLFRLPGLDALQPTPADKLAAYIIKTSQSEILGNHIHSNAEIMNG
jgi:uncharacterized protein YbjT (DUF2867 family)